jgi:hypothetical protein
METLPPLKSVGVGVRIERGATRTDKQTFGGNQLAEKAVMIQVQCEQVNEAEEGEWLGGG